MFYILHGKLRCWLRNTFVARLPCTIVRCAVVTVSRMGVECMWEEINAAGLAQLVTDFCTWLGASLIYGLLYEARGDHAQTATVVSRRHLLARHTVNIRDCHSPLWSISNLRLSLPTSIHQLYNRTRRQHFPSCLVQLHSNQCGVL